MAASKNLKNTISTLEGVLADFKISYMESQDSADKQMFQGLLKDAEEILIKVKDRLNYIEEKKLRYRRD
ncbi:DUF1657 domain-containing protein [Clostridium bovifaecis]|uniref:DUF1657 domain-containing protein n=1 Tax=Clostridium bovifaecis TaxID=2184719 RepID=A0A6I6FDH0_9CLOT|nr:DUF1657 domain-containing protein [Clostridium bovifaecis]